MKGKLEEENNPLSGKIVEVSKFEEKGSDVNLASYMLLDCFQDKHNIPILLSNDSDISTPLKLIKISFKRPIGLITPYEDKNDAVNDLKKYASFHKGISEDQLKQNQFPKEMKDHQGAFHCPKEWI